MGTKPWDYIEPNWSHHWNLGQTWVKCIVCETLQQLVSKAVRKRVCEKIGNWTAVLCIVLNQACTSHCDYIILLWNYSIAVGCVCFLRACIATVILRSHFLLQYFCLFFMHTYTRITDCMLTFPLQHIAVPVEKPFSEFSVAQMELNSVTCLPVIFHF